MANPLGRISGQLLKDNLTFDGRDWQSFDTDLLYLRLNGRRIGVNTDVPLKQLEINGTTTTTNLIVDQLLDTIKLGTQVRISGSTLTSNTDDLKLVASNYVFGNNIRTSKLDFNNNVISSLATDTKIEIRPDQTGIDPLLFGSAEIYSNLNVTGNLYTPYNITLDGNINFGSDNTDTIRFNADINSDIIPNVDAPSVSYSPAVTATWHSVRFKYDATGYTNLFLFWYIANTPWNLWVDANVQIGNHVYATRDGVRKYYGVVTAKPVVPGISAGDQITFTVSNPENHPAYFDYPDPIYPTTFEISAVPDGARGFSLGSNNNTGGKRWEGLYTELVNGQQVTSGSISGGGVNLALRPGKIWYVATNGLDSNVGNHQSGPFATIKHALDEASAGDTVHIYPGTYTEQFPLTVKTGVTVKGAGIRSVTVQPTVPTQTNNAFLLNGETTVSDLSVKDFYAPGYAFAFAPGFTVTTRSPYVQNITVITKGSVTSLTDPRGFDEGDAGGGAYVDGSLATTSSKEASMLFHSVTFITPGVDALTMTNGVRVEWLNSFSYFANRGLYATNGTLGLASQGVRFGAEIRSIGSANVYGNYGAEASGASTLMYLIQHNFAYIGAGKDVTNDPSLNIQDNETVELDSGKIYYQSLDNKGNFKVGDAFGVSFDTGLVAINGVSVSAGGVTSINFAAGTNETVIDATQVITGNVKFSNNLLTTLSGALNLDSGTNEINLNANTDVTDSLDVIGNLNVDGTLTIGNAYIDIVRFTAPVEFNLRPKTDDDYSLGGPINKRWDKVYLDTSYIGSYKLENATISTLPTDADIELRANSTGKIYVPTNNVQINNDLTVSGTTNLGDNALTPAATVTGTIDHTGLLDRTGDTYQTGTYNQDGYIDVSSDVQIANVTFIDNTISTVTLDSNLELGAASTGKVTVPSADVQIDHNLFVTGDVHADSVITNTDITADVYSNGNIEISLDLITTTLTDSDLEFRAAGTGKVYASQDNVKFDHDLTVDGTTALRTTIVAGDITQYGNYLQTGSTLQTGNRSISSQLRVRSDAYFDSMSFVNNTITTTDTDTDLRLKAALTGIIDINDNATFSQNLRVNDITYTNGITNSGTITSDTFSDGDIEISTNVITTTVSGNNLRLLAAGTGIISIPNDAVQFEYDLTVNGSTSLKNTIIGTGGLTPVPKTLTLTGDYLQTGSTLQTGNRGISSRLDVHSNAYFDSMSVVNNVITTTDTDTDLVLKAAGTGLVVFDENTTFSQGLSVATLVTNGVTNSGITTAGTLFDNDIQITSNIITTTVGSNNLRLLAAGSGIISVPSDAVEFNNNLTVNGSTSLKNTVIGTGGLTPAPKTINLTGNYLQTGNTLQTGNRSISAQLRVNSNAYFDSMSFVTNAITTTDLNTDLSLKAAGTGLVVFDENTTFSQSLTASTLVTNGLTNSGTITSDIFTEGDIVIDDNYITTTVGNNDLRLAPNGTGKVSIPLDPVAITQALTVQDTSILKNVTINGDITHVGNTTQTGNVVQTGDFDLSNTLTVTGPDAFFTDVRIINNRIATSTGNNNLELRANGTAIIKIADSATFGQTLTVNGTTTTSTISAVTGTITSDIFTDGDIEINDNYITTTFGNNNLILAGSTTGGPKLEKIKFNSNVISTETTNEGITLTVPSGNVTISAATALKIPVGTTVNRPTLTQGEFRFNSTDNLFRGYSTATVSFGGVYSADRRTSVLAHPTNNTILFTTNTLNNMTVSATGLTVNSLTVDNNLTFATNIISTAVLNNSLYLTPNGAGKVVIDDVSLRNDEIINSANAALVIQNTGNGYVRFSGTGGLALPAGPTVVDTSGVELGDLRYNTDLSIPEIFNGVDYVGFVSENAALLNAAEVQEITNLWALVIG
jgi:hypothetical protein